MRVKIEIKNKIEEQKYKFLGLFKEYFKETCGEIPELSTFLSSLKFKMSTMTKKHDDRYVCTTYGK